MKFQPLNKKVLIKITEEKKQETTASGIILPGSTENDKPLVGKIEAVASDVDGIKVGDEAMYPQYGGTQIVLGEDKYTIIDSENILGILN